MLRPYQQDAYDAVHRSFAAGKKKVVLVSAVGTGKTFMGAHIAKDKGRVLWVAHRDELLGQAEAALTAVGVTDFVTTTYQSNKKIDCDFTVFDEVHHAASDKWSEFCKLYDGCKSLGLTATPCRSDGRGLEHFDDLVVSISTRRAITDGYLVGCRIIAPKKQLRPYQLAASPVDAWHTHALGKKTVVFCANLKSAKEALFGFMSASNPVPAGMVHGAMPDDERADTLARFRTGELRVLVNVNLLTEGYDDPSIECVMLARNIGSTMLYIQCIGRALRPSPGKTEALLVDLHGSCYVHGPPDEEYEYSLEGQGIRLKEKSPYQFCQVCGALRKGDKCLDCGIELEQKSFKVVKTPMAFFEKSAAEGPVERAKTLAYYQMLERIKGYKRGWAYFRYRWRYKESPTQEVIRLAKDM